jgi:predicted dehydrogenase
MTGKVRWGILGVSNFALTRMMDGLKKSEWVEVAAIASRSLEKARAAAAAHGIPAAYGSYEELLADPSIEVVYNPLPNHLHVPWSIRALEAGKHVLCEKPLGMDAAEARRLIEARDRAGRMAGEAFMIRTHPQWVRAMELVRSGAIGELRSVVCWFAYFNRDAANVRNMAGIGGGGLYDIGCYAVFGARLLYGAEPLRAAAVIELDPEFGTDRLASAVLEFPGGHAVFTCSTQVAPAQRIVALGTAGRVEIEIPFNAPPDRPCRIVVDDGSELDGASSRVESFPVCDQYAIEGDAFSRAVRGEGPLPVGLETALGNMAVLDAIRRAAASGRWEPVG